MPIFPEAVREQLSSAALQPIGWSLNGLARVSPAAAGRMALRLFSHPRSSKSCTHHSEVLESAEHIVYPLREGSEKISVFRWAGKGPTLYLAHGWESNTSRWLELIRALRALDYHIIGVDAPAHGYSGGKEFNVPKYTLALEEVFRRFSPEIFIGHSAGGMAGVYHLMRQKDSSLRSLILLAVPHELEHLMDTFRRIVGMNRLVFEGLKEAFTERFGFPMSAFSIPEFAREIQLPGLVIHDKMDSIAPYTGGVAIHRNWEASKFQGTEGLGHSLLGEQVVQMVVDYLETGEVDE